MDYGDMPKWCGHCGRHHRWKDSNVVADRPVRRVVADAVTWPLRTIARTLYRIVEIVETYADRPAWAEFEQARASWEAAEARETRERKASPAA